MIESHLAKLMAAKRAFAITSGMSALDVISRLVKAGEEIIAGDDLYGGTSPKEFVLITMTQSKYIMCRNKSTPDLFKRAQSNHSPSCRYD